MHCSWVQVMRTHDQRLLTISVRKYYYFCRACLSLVKIGSCSSWSLMFDIQGVSQNFCMIGAGYACRVSWAEPRDCEQDRVCNLRALFLCATWILPWLHPARGHQCHQEVQASQVKVANFKLGLRKPIIGVALLSINHSMQNQNHSYSPLTVVCSMAHVVASPDFKIQISTFQPMKTDTVTVWLRCNLQWPADLLYLSKLLVAQLSY